MKICIIGGSSTSESLARVFAAANIEVVIMDVNAENDSNAIRDLIVGVNANNDSNAIRDLIVGVNANNYRNNIRNFIEPPVDYSIGSLTGKSVKKRREDSIQAFCTQREIKGMPSLPVRQTYFPPIHGKSKKW